MIDSHCHLNYIKSDQTINELVNSAKTAGVDKIFNIGTDLKSSLQSVGYAEQFKSVYATVGVHPHDAKTVDKVVMDRLRELTDHKKVLAVGEIGLDFYRNLSSPKDQYDAFESQLKLAVETKLPIVIHTRDAHKETVKVIKNYASDLNGGVFHCFQGGVDEALEVIELGFHISVGGVITFKNSQMSVTATEAPLDKIILETDSPFLTPVPFRGKTNKPELVKFVYKKLAELKGEPLSDIEKQIDRNVDKLFNLVDTFGD